MSYVRRARTPPAGDARGPSMIAAARSILAGSVLGFAATALAQDLMRHVDLSSREMTSAEMTRGEVEAALASGNAGAPADLSGKKLSGADLNDASLKRASIFAAQMQRAELDRADLASARIAADLSAASLVGASLAGDQSGGRHEKPVDGIGARCAQIGQARRREFARCRSRPRRSGVRFAQRRRPNRRLAGPRENPGTPT